MGQVACSTDFNRARVECSTVTNRALLRLVKSATSGNASWCKEAVVLMQSLALVPSL